MGLITLCGYCMLNIPESRPESLTKEFGREFSETNLEYAI